MTNYTISLLTEQDIAEYKRFITEHPAALYEHSLEVKDLIASHFKFKPFYILAKKGEKIVGALPLFEANSIIEGRRFVSIPFFPFGGVIGENSECQRQLLTKAQELSAGGRFLEIRQREEVAAGIADDFVKQSPITDFIFHFKKTEEETFHSLDKRVRYDINKARKNGLSVKLGKSKEMVADFYKVYLYTKKKRGVPAWPYQLFVDALETCAAFVGVTYLEQKPIAAAFFFTHRLEIEYGFAGADYRYTSLCQYYLLLWEVIRYGIKNGYSTLDFGGTTKELNDGYLYAFKERWCKEKKEIPYYFYAREKKNIPELKRSFGLYRLYGMLWQMLPIWLIKRISPVVIRQFI